MRALSLIGLPGRRLPAENTIPALEYALAHGCDGFEFDVRFTRDRRNVLCHDPKFRRREIAATEYAGLERRHGLPMACLEDVLTAFGHRAYLNIELKTGGNEEDVVKRLRAHPPARGYLVSSFLPPVLERLHKLEPALPLGYICKQAEYLDRWKELPIAVFLPHLRLLSQRLVEEVHERGVKVFAWTVNRRSHLVRFALWGVDGFISDNPKLLARTFLHK
jgi:glycerophosphoryl diester phosphodiesterase